VGRLGGPEALQASRRGEGPSRGSGVAEQPFDVEAEAAGAERLEAGDAAVEQAQGAAEVAPGCVVEADTHLEQSLVQPAHLGRLGPPGVLQHLVRLEPAPLVEEAHPLDEEGRGRGPVGVTVHA
jgi:hypothetical protein